MVATLNRVDAGTASIFVGRLLTEVFSPVQPGIYSNFGQAFFAAQYTTSLLYDTIMPLRRSAEKDERLKEQIAMVLSGYFQWSAGRQIDLKTFGKDATHVLDHLIHAAGLGTRYEAMRSAGQIRPETLFFTAFGLPEHVELV